MIYKRASLAGSARKMLTAVDDTVVVFPTPTPTTSATTTGGELKLSTGGEGETRPQVPAVTEFTGENYCYG